MRSFRGQDPRRRRGIDRRRPAIETLEDRLVLAVDLQSAAASDRVVLTLAGDGTQYDVAVGPASAGLDGSGQVVDLSDAGAGDQRYALGDALSSPLFRVDTGASYTFSAAGNPEVGQLQQGLFGYRSYDADRLLIEPLHVAKHGFAADTTLAADLNPGDTSFLIADAFGWSDERANPAETRALAWYGYADTSGRVYDDYTYTRNVAAGGEGGLWSPDTVWFDASAGAYRVPLNEPWDGPALEEGAAVRNAAGGASPSLPFPESTINAAERWETIDVEITGEWVDGQRDEFAFRPGTEFVEPYSNVNASIWTEVVFGPTGDADTPAETVAADADQSFTLDLDVLAKQVWTDSTEFLPGDLNGDGAVNALDYVGLRERSADEASLDAWDDHYGATPPANPFLPLPGDENGDGVVNAADYAASRETGEDLAEWGSNLGATGNLDIKAANAVYGTVEIISGPEGEFLRYESPERFVGTDVIEYEVRALSLGGEYTGRLAIEVGGDNLDSHPQLAADIAAQASTPADNTPPHLFIINDPGFATSAGVPLSFDAVSLGLDPAFRDVDGDAVAFRHLSGPANGSLSLNADGTFTYTPNDGFVGVDTFRFEAFDGVDSLESVAAVRVYATADELSEARLKDVALAMLNHESAFRVFPLVNNEDYFDENGDPYLSWRVHLLRYLDGRYRDLYDAFHLDEPWDSPNNLPLLDQIPEIYLAPGDPSDSTVTRLQTFTGNGAPFGDRPLGTDQIGPTLASFRDGVQHTILVAESAADAAVPWTKPDDLAFDPADPLAALGTYTTSGINLAMADGSVITVSAAIDAADFAALVTNNGDEVVDADTLAREYRESLGPEGALQPFEEDSRQLGVMRQITLAALNYESTRGYLPPDTLLSPAGDTTQNERGLSWRVQLLPFMGYDNLYERFNLDEAWDSPNNLALLDEMPDIFRSAGDPSDSTTTRIVRPKGDDTAFRSLPGDRNGVQLRSIQDGTSSTLFAIEAGADQAVPWTKPDDPEFDAADPLAALGNLEGELFYAALVDGSVARLPADIADDDFAALVTRNGGESVDVAALNAEVSPLDPRFKSNNTRTNDLRQLALAQHNYENSRGRLPANTFDSEGEPLLSWRVLLLPYIDEQALYDQFRLDEPWDSPHNLSLLDQMPEIYRNSGDPLDSVTTSIVTFTGRDETPYPSSTDVSLEGLRLRDIQDGTSNTLAFVDAGPEAAVPWTKPVDRPIPDNNPWGALGDVGEQFVAAFIDGHIETLSGDLSPSELQAIITRDGGEIRNDPPDIGVVPGFFVLESHGDTKTHEFGVDVFTVVLDLAPTADVVIDVSSSDVGLATIDQSRLTFTPDNWDQPQRIALRAVDNQTVNPDMTVDVTLSVVAGLSAGEYAGVAPQAVTATIVDDEPRPPALPGDYNVDGAVNALDYTRYRESAGAVNVEPYTGADGDGSGAVNTADHAVWAAGYGATPASAASAASDGSGAARFLAVDAALSTETEPARSIAPAAATAADFDDDLLLLAIDAVAQDADGDVEPAVADYEEDAPRDAELAATVGFEI